MRPAKGNNRASKKCPQCDIPLNVGAVFINCNERITFRFMEKGQSMHMECYIQHVMDIYWDQLQNDTD
jgi:hypothetical protein